MIKYKSQYYNINANAEQEYTILSGAEIDKSTLRGVSAQNNENILLTVTVNDETISTAPGNVNAGYGAFIPLDMALTGNDIVKISVEEISGSQQSGYIIAMYER